MDSVYERLKKELDEAIVRQREAQYAVKEANRKLLFYFTIKDRGKPEIEEQK